MTLTDNEKRDVVKLIEAGEPLPDKYRFLLFEGKREVELVWNGKTGEVCNVVLPFQVIEQVDEPRAEKAADAKRQADMFAIDARGRQLGGWSNKLIWGDNKLILSSLKNGLLREEIEAQGGIKLIYIDPPFDVGADFSMDIEIGDGAFTKKPNVLEELAYRDTWGKGADSFIAMIYERLALMRDLLAEDGSIYVHCDWRVNSYMRLAMDEVFGRENFRNEIVWHYGGPSQTNTCFPRKHDTILFFSKSGKNFNKVYGDLPEYLFTRARKDSDGRLWVDQRLGELTAETIQKMKREGKIFKTQTGNFRRKQYLDEMEGSQIDDVWNIPIINSQSQERENYPTQKPEAFIERIFRASSNEGDIVADFFCGSGTTAAVAEKLGRKWICTDLGKFAIHTTRKRMISVQRNLKADDKNYRAFEVLNLGKYERQHYIGVNPSLRPEQQQRQIAAKSKEYLTLILKAYAAQPVEQSGVFHGKKAGRMVAIGPINLPVTRRFVEEIILECGKQHITRADILAFEFEMGLFPQIRDEAKSKGIDIAPKYIPAQVFDKRAVEKDQVKFHDVSYIEVKTHITKAKKGQPATIAVELTDFSVHYSQDSNAGETLKADKSKTVAEDGQIVRLTKSKSGKITRENLTKDWHDWVDYWAVDFDFESKREIIRAHNEATGKTEEQWSGDYIFENEWQSFRTKKDRKLEFTSAAHKCEPGRRKIAVKVVDIFGNDTMKIVEVGV